MNGQGVWKFANGDIAEGEFKNDLLNGIGKYTWANGDTSEGEFKDNFLNGKGKKYWIDGSTYEGDFKNDLLHGKGKYIDDKGNILREVLKITNLAKEFMIIDLQVIDISAHGVKVLKMDLVYSLGQMVINMRETGMMS